MNYDKLGNYTDNECYYVDCTDAGKLALLLGPFKTHGAALEMVDEVSQYAPEVDAKAHFYSFGTVKIANGYRDGVLNHHFLCAKGIKNELWTGESLRDRAEEAVK